jgi:hypothetical protein
MKSLWIFCLCASFSLSAIAQISSGDDAPEKPAVVPTEEQVLDKPVFYRNPGSFIMSFSNIMVSKQRAVSMPVNLQIEATAFKNFTIGPMVTYFMLKNVKQVEPNQNRIQDGNLKYHQVMVGIRGSYHFMPILQKLIKKPMLTDYVDAYITGHVGYSVLFADGSKANMDFMDANQRIRGGAALGVRSMVLPRFGFFIEMGYTSYGYGSFGITTVIK